MSNALQNVEYPRHRMTIAGKRGLLMRSLAFRPNPDAIPGESLRGLAARAMVRNGFPSLTKCLRFADISVGTPVRLPLLPVEFAGRIAYVLKVPEEEVRSRMYANVKGADTAGDYIDFFGLRVRLRYLENSRRRISPRAMVISAHHRASYDLRVFSFCPETMERLIDTCPVCHKALGWKTTRGVAFCEHCADADGQSLVDLRDFKQPFIEVEDPTGLRLLTNLASPDVTLREMAVRLCDPVLRDMGASNIFELALTLIRALSTPPAALPAHISRLVSSDDFAIFEPAVLARSGRILMSWRRGFDEVAETIRGLSAERRAYSGLFKELGALQAATVQARLPIGVREILRSEVRRNMESTAHDTFAPRNKAWRRSDLVDSETVVSMLATTSRKVAKLAKSGLVTVYRTPARKYTVLFLKSEVEAIYAVRSDMIEGTKAARWVGVPLGALEALADAGRIARVVGPALALVNGRVFYRNSSVGQFVSQIRESAQCGDIPEGSRSFDATLRSLPAGERPWVAIFDAIASGVVPVIERGSKGPLFSRLLVDSARLQCVIEAGKKHVEEDDQQTLSYREAALFLRTSDPTVSWLVAAGLLQSIGNHDRRITKAAIFRFNEEYMFTTETADRLGIAPREVRRYLQSNGIEPVCALRAGVRFVWRRSDV